MKKEIKYPKIFMGLLVGSALASPITMLIFYLANPMFFYVSFALLPLLTLIPNIFFICASFFYLAKKKPLRIKIVFLVCNIFLLLWNLTYTVLGFMNLTYSILYVISLAVTLLHLLATVGFIIVQNTERNKNSEDNIYEKK